MRATERAEIEDVARELEGFGLRRAATRLRALLGEPLDDERPCPIQDGRGGLQAIPWGLAEVLYRVYAVSHGDQSLERLAQRGGFSRGELGKLAVGFYTSEPMRGYERRMPLLDIYELARRGLAERAAGGENDGE